MAKEIDIQVQEAQSHNQVGPKEDHTKTHHKMPTVKDKQRIFKAARENKLVTYRRIPIRLLVDFSKGTLQAGKKGLARSIQSDEKQGPTT